MSEKPEALRLADALTQPTYPDWVMHTPAPWHPPAQKVREAAAELRRLHELLEAEQALLQRVIYPELQRLRAQRDALLEALKALDVLFSPCVKDSTQADWIDRARAAIKAVEGEKNNGQA